MSNIIENEGIVTKYQVTESDGGLSIKVSPLYETRDEAYSYLSDKYNAHINEGFYGEIHDTYYSVSNEEGKKWTAVISSKKVHGIKL